MIEAGDIVTIYPHGSPELAASAEVVLMSKNGLSAIFAFADKAPFRIGAGNGMMILGGNQVMLAHRHELEGKPWGPWVELTGGGHYEVEEEDQRLKPRAIRSSRKVEDGGYEVELACGHTVLCFTEPEPGAGRKYCGECLHDLVKEIRLMKPPK